MRHVRIQTLGIICILGAAATIALAWSAWRSKKRVEQAKTELAMINVGLESVYAEFNRFSFESMTATEVLEFLSTRFQGGPIFIELWQGDGDQPTDPWGHEYCMIPGDFQTAPVFYSAGPNTIDEGGRAGTDDIRDTEQ